MRLQQYINDELNENFMIDDYNEMLNIIKKDCSNFLKEFGNTAIYRGTKDIKKDNTLIRMKSRIDRMPKDTPKHLHDLMDELFKKYHGWKARSEGVFVTKYFSDAEAYGTPALFFPKGNYKYLWSEDIDDLYVDIRVKIIEKILALDIETRGLEAKHITPEFKIMLEDIIKTYKTINFRWADDNECMFKVKNYYLVRFDLMSKRSIFMSKVGE